MKVATKVQITERFLRGERIADVAAFFAVTRSDVEQVLREAIKQLSELKAPREIEPAVIEPVTVVHMMESE